MATGPGMRRSWAAPPLSRSHWSTSSRPLFAASSTISGVTSLSRPTSAWDNLSKLPSATACISSAHLALASPPSQPKAKVKSSRFQVACHQKLGTKRTSPGSKMQHSMPLGRSRRYCHGGSVGGRSASSGSSNHAFRPCSCANQLSSWQWKPMPVCIRPALKMGLPWTRESTGGTAYVPASALCATWKSFSKSTASRVALAPSAKYSRTVTCALAGPG
mmetsp:Transcript_142263/g.396445  ORF Transcript_142263/g.396445 Transcript_142263/m.396445 type:complete len:218 (-) Transcript_142263:338-991(-)